MVYSRPTKNKKHAELPINILMSFKWIEYFRFSDQIRSQIDSFSCEEACQRSVISRAYYSVFKLAETHMNDNAKSTEIPMAKTPHQKTIKYYKDHQDPKRSRIGLNLERLKFIREDADYHVQFEIGNAEKAMETGIKQATTILENLRMLKNFKE